MPAHLTTQHRGPALSSSRRPGGRRAVVLATALVALAAPALSACGGDSAAAGGGATLKWTSSYFPTHWDPVVGGSGAQFRELALTYASLTRTDETGKAVPDLAKSWEYNKKETGSPSICAPA